MTENEQAFLTNLICAAADYFEDLAMDDEATSDFHNLFRLHVEHMQNKAQQANKGGSKGGKGKSHADKEGSASAKGAANKDSAELSGAALEANKIINAILSNYKGTSTLSTNHSVYADMYKVAKALLNMDGKGMSESFFNVQSADHDDLTGALTTPMLYQSLALNREIIHVKAKDHGDPVLLNTCDLFYKMPAWNLVFDLSECPECGRLSGLMIGRLSYNKPKDDSFAPSLVSTNTTDKNVFLDEIAISFCYDGSWLNNSVTFTLDEDKAICDLVREMGYFMISNEDDEPLTILERDDNLPEVDWDESESIMDPKLKDSEFAQNLYAAFKYVSAFLTHQSELKDAKGETSCLMNENGLRLPSNSAEFLTALCDRLQVGVFKHFYF